MADLAGTMLDGKYELSRMLGEGGMGTVYEATHRLIGRRLAVKFLHPQYVTSEEVVTRFQREAQAAAAIGHENIIEVTDMGTASDGAPYIVMEYLDGMDVKQLLAEETILSPARAAHVMVQALSALQAAHEVGIIHRDLKPENIYLIEKPDRPDYVKLLDFGISKFRSLESEGSKGLTQTGTVLGTPYYMSPEQARGDQNLSNRSDIYAMGVILYQMLAGSLPFDAPNYNALLIKILTEDPPPPDQLNPELPPELVETIQIAMDRSSENRFADCLEFRQRLLPFVPGSSTATLQTNLSPASRAAVQAAMTTHTETPLEMTRSGLAPPRSKLPIIIGAIAVSLAAVISVIIFGLGGKNTAPPAPAVPVAAPTPEVATPPVEQTKPAEKTPSTIRLTISASPGEAQIQVDGKPLDGNPFVGPFPKDDKTHTLSIKADGYTGETAEIHFDRDQKLSYKLVKAADDSKKKRSRGKPKRAEKPSKKREKKKKVRITEQEPEKPQKTRKKPRRKIDDEDPWG